MESKEDAVPELVLENAESGLQAARIDDAEEPADRDLIVHPFKRWVNSLRKNWRPPLPEKCVEGWPDVGGNTLSPYHGTQDQQWESLSAYSSQLGTVKTTSMSIPSQRGVRSRGTTASTTNQSGNSDIRTSIDSLKPTQSATLDEAAHSRSIKRRQLLQEIVDTESDYVFGLKSLSNVLSLFSTRSEICGNIQRIREIHDRFLFQLQNVSPKSNLTEDERAALVSRGLQKRLSAIDLSSMKGLQNRSLRTRSMKARMGSCVRAIGADPFEALEVAREIDKLSVSFTAYEEFCNNYELLTQDVALLRRSVSNWGVLDQGVEALSKSVGSVESRKSDENKSMTLNDLLIKVPCPVDLSIHC
ncbi:hypothetical protein PHISP_02060 [Aspergillus sp. HF37]|nr:hypothetical protein PHISP_02060 [Aspergillus sp. HF37]